jgi:hypothetical protein
MSTGDNLKTQPKTFWNHLSSSRLQSLCSLRFILLNYWNFVNLRMLLQETLCPCLSLSSDLLPLAPVFDLGVL